MTDPATAAREYVLESHPGVVESCLDCADAVTADWPEASTADPAEVAEPLARRLDDAGVRSRLPYVLTGAVRAAGFTLEAPPVAGPPYVVVTSTGPLLRATVSEGRFVVTLRLFRVERGDETRYVRGPDTPEDAVEVEFR